MENRLEISTIPYGQCMSDTDFDLDRIIYDLDGQIDLLSGQADTLDYLISVASGILCGMLRSQGWEDMPYANLLRFYTESRGRMRRRTECQRCC